jgi:O-antigen/teichoic acid export membrane protein
MCASPLDPGRGYRYGGLQQAYAAVALVTAAVAGDRVVVDMLDHNRSIAIVARNSKWSLIAFAISVLSNLILLPYVVRLIGIRQFGICGLLISVSTPLSLIGGILGQTACQAVARNRASNDGQATHDACATVTAFGALCISAGAVLLLCLIPIISRQVLLGDSPTIESISVVTLLLVTGWTAQQASLIMQGIHVACMAYRRIATINAISAVFNIAFTAAGVAIFPSVTGYLGALCAVQAATCLVWFASILLSFRWCLVKPAFVKAGRESIFAFSGWLTVSQVVAGLSSQADKYMLGASKGSIAVGYFNIALRVEEAAYSVMVRASDSLFPYFSSMTGDGQRPNAQFYFSVSWLVNLAAVAVIAPLIPWAPSIVAVWVDAHTAASAGGVLRVLAVAGLLGCASHVFKQYMLGARMTRQLAVVTIVSGSLAGLTAFLLVPQFGLRAAGFGAAAAAALQLGIVIHLVRRQFGELATFSKILHSTIIPVSGALAIAGLMTWFGFAGLHTWPRLIGAYVATGAGIMLVILMTNALSQEGRSLLTDLRTLASLVRGGFTVSGERGSNTPSAATPASETDAVQGVDLTPPV